MLPIKKIKGFIWVKAKNLYLVWFNPGFMQAFKFFEVVCEFFHLLNHGRPMTEFECFRYFYLLLNVKNNLRKHWIDDNKWDMAKCMHKIVLQNIKIIV
jgi:hypothetical protein